LPNGTTTDAGTVAAAVLLATLTDSPPEGAGAESVIVACTGTPAIDTEFDRYMLWSVGTMMTVVVRVAVWLAPEYVAVITVDVATLVVVIEKLMLLEPSGIVTLAGTVTLAVLLERVIAAPPAGAFPVSVKIPVTGVPPSTDTCDKTTLASVMAVGAVVVVVSEHPEASKLAAAATYIARHTAELKRLRFTTPIVASKPRPKCDRTMAQP
jgi:hypothetical protein